ncbi:hypothetical protein LWI28_006897 [Acer negundo]|uniref:Cytochrome P450 n=1 Tax=Acer negundo TaxID=4023 RepID=A0AAD5J9N7_ACENE|nr:hypothetical protein LWI28_006897 [Acer negundo]
MTLTHHHQHPFMTNKAAMDDLRSRRRCRLKGEESKRYLCFDWIAFGWWTLIAGRLPGRTDNEIKNYWKTNLSKKLKGDDKNTSMQLHKSKKKINGCSRKSSMMSNSQESKPAEPHQVFRTKAVRCTKVIIPGLLDYNQTVDHNVGAENIVSQSSSAPVPQEVSAHVSLHLHASSVPLLHASFVPLFNGLNFSGCCEQVQFHLGVLDLDLALQVEKPAAITDTSSNDQKAFHKAWEKSNRLSLMFMRMTVANNIKSIFSTIENAKEFMKLVEERSQKADKSLTELATSCRNMIEEWKKMVDDQESCELDIWPEFQKLTADAISRAAFGSNYEEGKKIFELQKELIQLVLEAMMTLYIPGFRFVPTKKNRRRKKLYKEITAMLRNLVQGKANAINAGESRVADLLGLLLQSNNQINLQENARSGMTIEEVIEECKAFYLAGQETTSSWLTWTIIVLAMHPDWQEKAREEVLQACQKKEPDYEALTHLKIVTGVDVVLPTLLIHHDPELWGDDAEEFKPERFAEGVSKASKNQLAFFPFGWGPRTCIGQNYAILEAKMALAMILQNFSFQLSPSYSHAPHTVLILQPQHGAQMIIQKL